MSRRPLTDTMSWLREGTSVLLSTVDRLADDELRQPSLLPGWSRAHVVAHLARNAEALGRLAASARTGVRMPAYLSRERRDADIEESAGFPADRLRTELADTATTLAAAFEALDETSWQALVDDPRGRDIPATEMPWLRVREVWLHAVDLNARTGMGDLPAGVLDGLLGDAARAMSERPGCPAVLLEDADREGRSWRLRAPIPATESPGGSPPAGAVVTVRGASAELAGWLLGRTGGSRLSARGPGGHTAPPTPPPFL